MHINFRKIKLHNFLSFGDSTLFFEDDGFIRVTGVNESPDDHAISNGSGKSSLWEAIVWALTGSTIRGTKQISNIYGEDGTYVDLEFEIDGISYQILRSKDHQEYKTNIRIFVDGKDCSGKGIRDSEKILEQLLPDITPSLLGSVIILGQGLPQKFTNNSPSGRKEVLEKLSKSDFMIEDLKNRVSSRKNQLHTEIRSIEDELLTIKTTIKNVDEQLEVSKKALEVLDNTELQNQYAETELQLVVYQSDLDAHQLILEDAQERLNSINKNLQEVSKQKEDRKQTVEVEFSDDISFAESQVNALLIEKTSTERELSRMESIKDRCPTCGQTLPDVHKPDTDSIKESLATITQSYNSAKSNLEELVNRKKQKIQEIDELFSDMWDSYRKDISDVTAFIEEQKKHINVMNANINVYASKLNELQKLLTEFDTQVNYYNTTIQSCSSRLHELNDKLLYNTNEKDLQQTHLEVITKFETALKRDFRGYLLSNVIEFIQRTVKMYSSIIFDNDKIDFYLDGNNVEITYLDKSYENLSGGEKQKIDIILQLSIRDMLCSHLGFTSNILVLDEVFDGLDMIGCQKILDVISNLSDIKNVFIVTHRKDLSIPMDKELLVVKSSLGISEIRG